ncbi:hypothetical protein F0344_34070 [Streptomyces finlayi]|uniref:Uncharacterized protein n=1 Tax=Streptomyces finlayi TaxID=67296 RepID=A0A7G7BUD3_9ACTN|nr:hypothetical protein F0344_34070 [Streptomyces finlayi]
MAGAEGRFRRAGNTKAFTAAAVMRQVADGRVRHLRGLSPSRSRRSPLSRPAPTGATPTRTRRAERRAKRHCPDTQAAPAGVRARERTSLFGQFGPLLNLEVDQR